MPDREAEEIPFNKIYVDILVLNVIRIKLKKENLNLKSVTVIEPFTGWFKPTQYDDKLEISIKNLFEATWLSRYPRSMEITFDQRS